MQKPIILKKGQYTLSDLQDLKNTQKIWEEKDLYDSQYLELLEIQNPSQKPMMPMANTTLLGDWIYFSWSGCLLHTLTEDDLFRLQTNRNQLIITRKEQQTLYQKTVGIAGLSIGSHFAENLVYSGFANSLKLAENDTLDTSNLNRVKFKLKDIGEKKMDLCMRSLYEINPHLSIQSFDKGLDDSNLSDFIDGGNKPLVVFEAIDDFKMKIKLRLKAKMHKVPVIMLTNLGDNILIDIERFDQDPNLALFNGKIGETPQEILDTEITEKDKTRFAAQIVGLENLPTRVQETLMEIGKTLVGRPQINQTVTIAGGLASYLFRRIALNLDLPSGRMVLNLAKALQNI